MFKRKGDIREYNYLYSIPAMVFIGSFLAGHYHGYGGVY